MKETKTEQKRERARDIDGRKPSLTGVAVAKLLAKLPHKAHLLLLSGKCAARVARYACMCVYLINNSEQLRFLLCLPTRHICAEVINSYAL